MSDLISRQDAIKACFDTRVASVYDISDLIEMLPSVELPIKEKCCVCPHCDNCDVNEDGTIERKTGEWIDIDCQSYTWKVCCSECGHERSMMSTQGQYPKFCEECGADMRGEEE